MKPFGSRGGFRGAKVALVNQSHGCKLKEGNMVKQTNPDVFKMHKLAHFSVTLVPEEQL